MRLFLAGVLPIFFLFGAPKNPIVLAGSAICDGEQIVVADRTILNWDDFGIEEGERIVFVLPHSEAFVLNRVIEERPSRLMGELQSNGRVALINPSGIFVGGKIDAETLILSNLDVVDWLFVEKGEWAGQEVVRSMLVNQGEIQGRKLYLIGFEVQNRGLLAGELIALMGAKHFFLDETLNPVDIQKRHEGVLYFVEEQGAFRFLWRDPEEEEWPLVASLPEVRAQNMPGPTVLIGGTVLGERIWCIGEYISAQNGSLLEGEEIWIGGENARIVRLAGSLIAKKVIAASEGAMRCLGEISAKELEIFGGIFFESLYHGGHD